MKVEDLDIRYTRVTDTPYVKKWLMDPRILSFFPMKDEKEVELALSCWMHFVRYSCSLTATYQHIPCGIATLFLMPYKKVSHHCSMKVCVDPNLHRRGIGTALVRNLKHLAAEYFHLESLHIEIFEGNPIVHLLKKQGFREFIRQEDYVKEGNSYRARVCLEVTL